MSDFLNICKSNDMSLIRKAYFDCEKGLFDLDENGNTAVHIAIINNNPELLNSLLKWDLFMDVNNHKGKSPYQLILDSENKELLDVFLTYCSEEGFATYFDGLDIEDYVNNKEFLSYLKNNHLQDYQDVVYEEDQGLVMLKKDGALAATLLLDSIKDPDSLVLMLDYAIQTESADLAKGIIVKLYKKHRALLKENTEMIIKDIIMKGNLALFDFFVELIEIENLNQKMICDCICLYSTNSIFEHFVNKYINAQNSDNIRRMMAGAIVRNSIFMTDYLIKNCGAQLPENTSSLFIRLDSSADYIEYLFSKGFALDLKGKDKSLLAKCIENNNNQAVMNIVSISADALNFETPDGENLLHIAVQHENVNMINYLIESGVNPNKISDFGFTPLMASLDKDISVIKAFVDYFKVIDFDSFDNNVNSILNVLVQIDDMEKIQMVLPFVRYKNMGNISGFNPLLMAVNNGKMDTVKLLVEHEVDVNYLFNNTSSVYDFALFLKHNEIADFLRENGAISFDDMKNRPITEAMLEEAVLNNNIEQASYLLSAHTKDSVKYNNTALPNKTKDLNMLRLLMLFGFDINGVGLEYPTPLMNAIIRNDNEMANFLIQHGAFLNNYCEVENEMHNSLSLAIKNKNIKLIKKLLEAKIDVNFKQLTINDNEIFTLIKQSLPVRKVKKMVVKKSKTIEKKSFFKSIETEKYVIEKDDTPYIKDVKMLLNIVDECECFDDFSEKCENAGFKLGFMLESQSFEDVRFESAYNVLKLEDLSMTISQLKEKIRYNYFNDFPKMVNHVFLTERNTAKDKVAFSLLCGNNIECLQSISTINEKTVGFVYEGKRVNIYHSLLGYPYFKVNKE